MKSTDTMLRLAGLLSLLLLLYAFSPWVNENTRGDLTRLTPLLAVLSALVAIRIWMQIVMLDDAPDGKLLHTAEGKRELLWRLSDSDNLERQSLPWWNKAVFVWLGYRGAFFYAIALTLITTPFGKPLFVLTGFSIPTLLMSVIFLVTRFRFEKWATAHPETVERVLNTPEVQNVLEQQPQGA